MKVFKLILPLVITLAGCGSTPTQVVVAPDFIQTNELPLNISQISLAVKDLRASKHLVQILKEGQAANLFNSQQPISEIIENTLADALKSRNISIDNTAQPAITVSVEKALVNVEQQTLKYKSNSDLLVNVDVQTALGKMTKSYHHKGTSEGALKADIAVLGRDFNQALTKVLNQILTDQELFNYINQ
ncbi:hypothetical protein LP316_06800 [Thalassotalea sp. LPB0316]|uniref:YajG family lipoprotein n=1 Tax=Thalassotalea sp. LPB0316 TaxID=2769490 RepID=UPI001867FDB7|nr:YajG family lipoprotein [Thalassotalea sp. LPB0316]QOL26993.1 hypothetical protein LP316_06800 [Thalassotalea sp. LPB0316]